ncbi:MAG: hypothetical protein PUD22_10690 [Erysipelotrichaceae bacterium]|nr:hypothetical protein [Erysipelotrichaceae bacterium]
MKNLRKKLYQLMAVILTVSMMFSVFTITSFTASAAETNSEVAGEFYASSDFEYNVLDDDTAKITEYTGKSTVVEIPSEIDGYTVTSIGFQAFCDCTSLTSINVDNENQYYCSVDGVLFSKDKTVLIKYPAGSTLKTYSIPNSVTFIEDCVIGKNYK